jgi:hypothetical protein
MAFAARKLKKGMFEVQGLEAFIEQKLHELKVSLGLVRTAKASPVPAAPKPARLTKAAKVKKPGAAHRSPRRTAVGSAARDATVERLRAVLAAHPRGRALAKAGAAKDQLLRALIPLYLSRGEDLAISSGATSRFWARQGVTFAAPNAAKALRQHPGHSKRTSVGMTITPRGVSYVESVLDA